MKLTWSETNMCSILEEMKSAKQGIIEQEQSSKCLIQNDERRSKIGSVYTPCCWAKPPFKLPTPPSPYYQLSLLHENLNHKSPHYKPIEFSTRLREREHSGIRTQDKLLFHFNIFFEFLWMETMSSIGDDQADEERVWNNWIGIESLTVRSAQPWLDLPLWYFASESRKFMETVSNN